MDRQQISAANLLFVTTANLGIKFPKAVQTAHENLTKVRDSVAGIGAHDTNATARAVADALILGADPMTDPGVARAIQHTAVTMPGVIDHVENAAGTILMEAVRDNMDDMVYALREPFDKAAETLVTAHGQIGNLDLKADSEAILRRGGDIAEVWAQAVKATETIETVLTAWSMIVQLTTTSQGDNRWLALRITMPTAERFDELDMSRTRLTPWDAVCNGLPLTLPTLSEHTKRRAAIVEERAAIQAAKAAQRTRPNYLRMR